MDSLIKCKSEYSPTFVITPDSGDSIARIPTGFPELDETIAGGIPKPSLISVSGESLSAMNHFVFQMAHNFLAKGLKGLYVCLDRTGDESKKYFKELGLDIEHFNEDYSIFFLDFFSKSQDALIETAELDSLEYNPDDSFRAIGQFLDWIKNGFLIIDTFSTFSLNLDAKKAYEFVRSMKLLARTFNLIVIAIAYTSPMDPKTINVLNSVSDGTLVFEKERIRVASFLGLHQSNEALMTSMTSEGKLMLRPLLPEGFTNKTKVNLRSVFSKSPSLTIMPKLTLTSSPEIDLPIKELNQNLAKLNTSGILEAKPFCSSVSCPRCDSQEIYLYLKCPACKNILMEKGETLEHFNCGHTDFRHNFEHEEELSCPKCNKELRQIGVDYKQVGSWYKCTDGHTFPNVVLQFTCQKCNLNFNLDNAKIETQKKFELTKKGKQSLT